MEQGADIRWIQRYANFHKACGRLLEVTEADRFIDDLSELELEGLYRGLSIRLSCPGKFCKIFLSIKAMNLC